MAAPPATDPNAPVSSAALPDATAKFFDVAASRPKTREIYPILKIAEKHPEWRTVPDLQCLNPARSGASRNCNTHAEPGQRADQNI